MNDLHLERTRPTNVMHILGFMGLVPFVCGLVLSIIDKHILGYSGEIIFVTYSAVILSFLSGILWGTAITNPHLHSSSRLLLLSNMMSLLAWFSLLLSDQDFLSPIVILAFGYITVWRAEKSAKVCSMVHNLVLADYAAMRTKLTVCVVLLHSFMCLTVLS
ncbi:DUF3429 domain-containing protein [Vibrio sagamiensis]|uniref:DUF3429 domain-containing protein n=1 Tax=Vibrio sagamiensis NBRC 104589 TaxID=1219064 RepID=A0A511QC04_9VIBR|nr:DUF3429 domain-containing protein [Vibrio sagamiensis]PNQ54375.1 DUF3429 domain-containing protein [Vibrio agarivorans]GEM74828.1 hypothetical protein VSA01S_09400 [Vibrio sagamiensis NBRC 104589]